jgi:hypothetical protein
MVVRSEYINECFAKFERKLDSKINEQMVDSNEVKARIMLERVLDSEILNRSEKINAILAMFQQKQDAKTSEM